MTLHRMDLPAAFGYEYGYGSRLMLYLVDYKGSCLTFGKDLWVTFSVPAAQSQLCEP